MSEWQATNRLESLVDFMSGTGFSEHFQGQSAGDIPFYKVSDMSTPGNELHLKKANNYVSAELARSQGWKIIPAGAVVFAKVGAALLLNRRRILSCASLIDNNMMAALPKEATSTGWIYWQLLSVDFADFAQDGALPSVNQKQLHGILIPSLGAANEDQAVEILDTLDTVIRETEALIDKLQAVKRGLLHDLLTRGIDANGQLRPPQSEAPQLYKESRLGMIPREWVIHAVSDIARVTVGHVGPIEEHFSEGDGSVPLLSTTSIGEDGRLHGELRYVSASFDRTHGNSHLFPADLIVARHGKSGLTAVVPEEISAAQSLNVVIVRASPMFISGFLAASLNHPPTRSRLLGGQAGSVQPIVGTRAVASLEVAIPGREEQLAIWARNEALMTKIDLEVQYVESLRAIKQGLMDDLLTGRVRVTPLLESMLQAAAPTGA
ncbi:hypothetical protein [Pseudomonas oryzihabitans]|uniref:hypothetical protein n=1 Tax=Pseudomonas oryzihabitans TaxID=47885 RepID=UPI002B1E6C70|nr:hypothetical protein [Pseudomonas oryzihabitans]